MGPRASAHLTLGGSQRRKFTPQIGEFERCTRRCRQETEERVVILDPMGWKRASLLFGITLPWPFDVTSGVAGGDQPIVARAKLIRLFPIWSFELDLDSILQGKPCFVLNRDRSTTHGDLFGFLLVPAPYFRVRAKIRATQNGTIGGGWIDGERTGFDLFQLHERASRALEIVRLITQFNPLTSGKTAYLIAGAGDL